MNSRLPHHLLLFVFALSVTCSNRACAQLSEGISVRYSTENAIMGIVFQPQNMAESMGDDEVKSQVVELFDELFGVNLLETNQIYLQFGNSMGEMPFGGGPMFSLMVDSAAEIESDGITQGIFSDQEFETTTHNGQEILVTDETGPCLFFPDANTGLLSFQKGIEALIDQRDGEFSPELLMQADGNCDVAGFIDFENNQDELIESIEGFVRGIGGSDELLESLSKANRGLFQVQVLDELAIQARVELDSEADALALIESAEDFRENWVEQFEEALEEGTDDVEIDCIKAMRDLFKQAEFKPSGNDVMIEVKLDGGGQKSFDGIMGYFLSILEEINRFRNAGR